MSDPMKDPGPAPSLRTRDAMGLGATRGVLAGPNWHRPMRGIVRPGGPSGGSLQRVYDVAELLPEGAAIGGWAAGLLLGADELDGLGPDGASPEPVPVVLPPPLLIRERPELVRWRSDLDDDDLVIVDGIPCTTRVRTAFDLARWSPLRLGVVRLDVIGRQLAIPMSDVERYARRHPRWRGKPQALEVLKLADPRARSTGETRMRLVWVLDARLPAPEVNPSVFDGRDFLIGVADLLDPSVGLVGEYDGAHHREARRHAADNAREEDFEDAGLVVVRAGSIDLSPARRAATVRRFHAGHRRAVSSSTRAGTTWSWRPQELPN